MGVIRVLLAEDHQIVRDGIKALLIGSDDIQVAAEVSNGREALEVLKDQSVDVAILDVSMPEMNGIEATETIRSSHQEVKVLALTMHHEDSYIKKMLEAGAHGYILKNTGKDELIQAIQAVAQGKNYFSNEVYSKLIMNTVHGNKAEPDVSLTHREIEILRLIAHEMKNNEIGKKLNISTRTVDTHRRNLLQKLNVKNTAGLVRYAMRHGYVSEEEEL